MITASTATLDVIGCIWQRLLCPVLVGLFPLLLLPDSLACLLNFLLLTPLQKGKVKCLKAHLIKVTTKYATIQTEEEEKGSQNTPPTHANICTQYAARSHRNTFNEEGDNKKKGKSLRLLI